MALEQDGAPVAGLVTRKAEALLVYLACTGRSHSRDELAALLWDDLSPPRALNNLSVLVSSLRKQLEPALAISTTSLGVKAGACWVDAQVFERGVRVPGPLTNESAARLAETLALYGGDFLSGFAVRDAEGFESWVDLEREQLRRLACEALHRLALFDLERGSYAAGVAHATRLVELDPLDEAAHRHLMRLLALSGQRSRAMAQYEACRRVLEEELGVAPMAETTALYEQIRAGDLTGATGSVRDRVEPVLQPGTPAATPTPSPPAEAPFVGRARELATLGEHLERALQGNGGCVFVLGEPGSGKTALARAFAHHAEARQSGLLVTFGRCHAVTGQGDPYLPFREALRLLAGDMQTSYAASIVATEHAGRLLQALPTTIQALLDRGPQLLERFVPAAGLLARAMAAMPANDERLRQVRAALNAARDGGGDAQQLLSQCTAVLLAIAEAHPLVLILEDLHWADRASVELLFHLGRHTAGHRLLVVGTYRPDEVAAGRAEERHPLEKVVAELRRMGGDVAVDLDAATALDGQAFVDAYLDAEPNLLAQPFRAALTHRTRGHPLFTVELVHALRAQGGLVRDQHGRWVQGPSVDWDALPARVEGAIEERLGRLDHRLSEMLSVASVEGEVFTAQVIAQVLGAPEQTVVRQLSHELGARHRLVAEHGSAELSGRRLYRYRFRHHLFQHHLYHTLGGIEREVLHAQVGQALEALLGERAAESAPQLARHFLEAGDGTRAFRYLLLAGDQAMQVFAQAEAVDHYSRALELVRNALASEGLPDAMEQHLLALYHQRGRALELDGQVDQANDNYLEMQRLAEQRGDAAMRLAALMARAVLHSTPTPLFDAELGDELSEQAIALARQLGDREGEAHILWNLVNLYRFTARFADARACGERSLALARELGLQRQQAFALNDLTHVYASLGDLERSLQASEEAIGLWRRLGDLPMLADALGTAGMWGYLTGSFERAASLAEEGAEICARIGSAWGQAYNLWSRGAALWGLNQPEQGIAVLEQAIAVGDAVGFTVTRVMGRGWLAGLYGSVGAVDRAIELASLALADADTHRLPFRQYALAPLVELNIQQGDLDAAAALLASTEGAGPSGPLPVGDLLVLRARGWLALASRRHDEALALLHEAADKLRRNNMRVDLPQALRLKSQALVALGHLDEAVASLQEACAVAEAVGCYALLWPPLLELSRVEARRGNAAEAARLRERAHRAVTALSAKLQARELRRSFQALPNVLTALGH